MCTFVFQSKHDVDLRPDKLSFVHIGIVKLIRRRRAVLYGALFMPITEIAYFDRAGGVRRDEGARCVSYNASACGHENAGEVAEG